MKINGLAWSAPVIAQSNVETPDAFADRRSQGAFDAHPVLLKGLNRFRGKPGSRLLEGLFTGKHFLPEDLSFFRPAKLDSVVQHPNRRYSDVGAGAVAYNIRNDGSIRHSHFPVNEEDFFSRGQYGHLLSKHSFNISPLPGSLCSGGRLLHASGRPACETWRPDPPP
jgi:hypothetical protein